MRKKVRPAGHAEPAAPSAEWLDLDQLAEVELTSEDPDHPIDSALIPGTHPGGWRAAQAGEQTIRLLLTPAQDVSLISLEFNEADVERTQEFVLRWSPDPDGPGHEVVRQQWNFSPGGATRQAEEFHVDLRGVAVLKLTITPDISGGDAKASLTRLQLS